VHERLAEALGLRPTSRTKTTGTLVEKLQRNPNMALSRMQDIAGVRPVVEMNRSQHDELVDRIVELFPRTNVMDRRAEPSHNELSMSSSKSTSGSSRFRCALFCRISGRRRSSSWRTPGDEGFAMAIYPRTPMLRSRPERHAERTHTHYFKTFQELAKSGM
jgi:hypothetical protein